MSTMLDNFNNDISVMLVGANGGIGQALLKHLCACGNVQNIFSASRSPHKFSHKKIISINLDFDNEASIAIAAEKVDRPLNLIMNATGFLYDENIQPEKSFTQIDTDSFIENIKINTLGPALIAKHFLPLLCKTNKSVFAALSARVGSISDNGLGGWHSYRASKAALNMLIKNFAIEQARKNKQSIVVGLHPGTVNTQLSKPYQANVPDGKLFTPEYSAECLLNVVNQLTSNDSGFCFDWNNLRIPA